MRLIANITLGTAASLLLVACAATTPTAQKAATAALGHLTTYEVEVLRKIKAESDYYERATSAMNEEIVDLWGSEQPFYFDQESKKFSTENLNEPQEKVAPKLVPFMEATRAAWVERDRRYETLLTDTQKSLSANRRKLELERGKIKALTNKLQTLSAARTNREMLILAIAFAKEVKKKYDEIDASAAAAPAGTTATTPASQ